MAFIEEVLRIVEIVALLLKAFITALSNVFIIEMAINLKRIDLHVAL